MKERLEDAFREYENALIEYIDSDSDDNRLEYARTLRIVREILVEELIEAMGGTLS